MSQQENGGCVGCPGSRKTLVFLPVRGSRSIPLFIREKSARLQSIVSRYLSVQMERPFFLWYDREKKLPSTSDQPL